MNTAWSNWKNILLNAVRDNIPVKRIRNINSPPWITGEIIHAIKKKETARRKQCAHQIVPSLCLLFNRVLNQGALADEWKLANIVPVHKKGDKSEVVNYRPISLLCIVSKILERCVLYKLSDHLIGLINSQQHGFIPGRSCTTQLVEVLDHIERLLDNRKQTTFFSWTCPKSSTMLVTQY